MILSQMGDLTGMETAQLTTSNWTKNCPVTELTAWYSYSVIDFLFFIKCEIFHKWTSYTYASAWRILNFQFDVTELILKLFYKLAL